ncbi:MAG: response regulator [Acholeplasmataceae bacterium]
MMNNKILIIEDDHVILRFLSLALNTHGYETITATEGISGINMHMNHQASMILLDLGLPDIDGIDLIKEIRRTSDVPIIVISARGREIDKVNALDLGANDYVTKPFNIGEVLARIRVAFRTKSTHDDHEAFQFESLTIDFDAHKITYKENDMHLTPIEFKLLTLLVKNQGKVLTHSFIHKTIWGYETSDDYQSLRVFMAAIRRKFSNIDKNHNFIITEVGVGYRFRDY